MPSQSRVSGTAILVARRGITEPNLPGLARPAKRSATLVAYSVAFAVKFGVVISHLRGEARLLREESCLRKEYQSFRGGSFRTFRKSCLPSLPYNTNSPSRLRYTVAYKRSRSVLAQYDY